MLPTGALVLAVLAAAAPTFAQQQIQQQQIQGQRIGAPANQGSRIQGGVNRVPTGSGNALGDGSGMGGQTFNWSRGAGAGRAMGSGNALDANNQVGSGGSNNSQTPVDYNARNLVITNSVPGGRGFRGSVGYTADTDFRGRTGSDSSYRFRADSAMSNPAFVSSMASRDRFLVAQGLGVFEFRRDTTPVGMAERQAAAMGNESRLRLDRLNADMSFGRMNWELGEDRTVARGTSQDGQAVRYIVSPLRGLQSESLADPIVQSGLGLYEQARARADMRAGLTTADDYLRDLGRNLGGSMRVEAQQLGTSLGNETRVQNAKMVPKTYFDLVEELDKRAETKTGVKGGGLAEVREQVGGLGKKPATQTPGATGTRVGEGESPALPGEPTTEPNKPSSELQVPDGGEAEREAKRIEERGKLLPVPEMAEILRHGKTFDQLGTGERRRVDDLVRQGEEALRKGEYFQAERRFNQAESVASGNPLVEVGIAHAQIGAGLYLSAGLTLRNLFTSSPELIDARYDAKLLPTGERLTAGVKLLRERILRGDDAPGYGLVLAYIGHQTSDRALVTEGLTAIVGSSELDAQRALLEAVWAPKQ
ncbi:MAG: hypothetical protein ACKO3W_00275 [bacterium]